MSAPVPVQPAYAQPAGPPGPVGPAAAQHAQPAYAHAQPPAGAHISAGPAVAHAYGHADPAVARVYGGPVHAAPQCRSWPWLLALGAEIVGAVYCRYMFTSTAPKYVPPPPPMSDSDCPVPAADGGGDGRDGKDGGDGDKPHPPPQDPALYQGGIAACGALFAMTLAGFLFECWHAPIARAPTAPPVAATSSTHIGLETMGYGRALHGPAPPRYAA